MRRRRRMPLDSHAERQVNTATAAAATGKQLPIQPVAADAWQVCARVSS